MQESGNTLGAQKIILKELETQFGGAAKSEGATTEAMQQLQTTAADMAETLAAKVLPVVMQMVEVFRRHWPRIKEYAQVAFDGVRETTAKAMDWINKNVVPTIRAVVKGATEWWERMGPVVTETFGLILRTIKRIMVNIRETVELVMALLRGDWSRAWSSLKTIVTNTFGGILDYLRTLPKIVLGIGKSIGGALKDGIVGALKGIGSGIANSVRAGVNAGIELINQMIGSFNDVFSFSWNPPGPGSVTVDAPNIPTIARLAVGGRIAGTPGAPVPIVAHAGEVVLNPRQQREVGIDRIMDTLRRTGGIVGGSSFAAGGVVASAMNKARSNLGEPYGKPSRGESRTGPNSWDCSGYATYVAGVNVGGTTASAYGASSAVSDHSRYPIVWGFRKSHSGGYRGGYDEHMGVRVGGVWYQTSGGRTAQTGSDGDWQEIRVPAGLGNIQSADGDGPGGEAARGRGPSLEQRIKGLIGGAAAKALGVGVPDLSSGSAPGFSGSQDRSVSKAGRAARGAARAAGKSPEEVARAGEVAERDAEIAILRKQVTEAKADLKKLQRVKASTLTAFRKLGRKKVGPGNRAAKRRAMGQYRAKLRAIDDELDEVREEIAQLNERLMEIGEAIEAEAYGTSFDTGVGSTDASSPVSDPATVPAGPTPDQQAAIDQANARAETATRGQQIAESWARTLFSSPSIDLGQAWGGINITVQSFHPSDPATLDVLSRTVVAALGGQGAIPASTFQV